MWRTKKKREINMSEERKVEATKIIESVEQLIDSVCERKIGWTEERQLLDKMSEMRDKALSTVYDFNQDETERHLEAKEYIGIAQGIEFALSVMGAGMKVYVEDLIRARDDINKVIELLQK